jgi:hypothetical protein
MMYAIGMKGGPMSAQKRIAALLEHISSLGPMLPGSISEQWNVCGTVGCACKAAKNPVKHGPYFQLSFSVQGKSSTMFIKQSEVAEARRRINRYQQFKQLSFDLIRANVELAREDGLSRSRHNA